MTHDMTAEVTVMTDRVTVAEAADRLGISKEAVRRRIDRNTLRGVKNRDGTWRVILPNGIEAPDTMPNTMPDDMTPTMTHDTHTVAALLAEKDARIALLASQMGEKDRQIAEKDRQLVDRSREIQELHILLQTTQRLIPPVVATASERHREGEEREGHDLDENTAPERSEGVPEASQKKPAVPWWRRFFLGEM